MLVEDFKYFPFGIMSRSGGEKMWDIFSTFPPLCFSGPERGLWASTSEDLALSTFHQLLQPSLFALEWDLARL